MYAALHYYYCCYYCYDNFVSGIYNYYLTNNVSLTALYIMYRLYIIDQINTPTNVIIYTSLCVMLLIKSNYMWTIFYNIVTLHTTLKN